MVWHKNVSDAFKLLTKGKAKFSKRSGWSVAVECWFCGHQSEVPFGNRNCWDCPSCEQYNGFLKDGDYNKPIPAQRNEALNHPVSPLRPLEGVATPQPPSYNPLCYTCQQNQLIKVRQLADFVPYNEADFDFEVEAYSRHLEVVYRLCRDCELKVQSELQRQDKEIKKHYSTESDDDSDNTYIPHIKTARVSWTVRILRLLSVLCAAVMLISCISNHISNTATVKSVQDPTSNISTTIHSSPPGKRYQYVVDILKSTCQLSPVINVMGFFFTVSAIFLLGQEWLTGVDVGQCLTWCLLVLYLMIPNSSPALSDLLQPLQTSLTATVLLLSLLSLCQARRQEARLKSPATFKKYRRATSSCNPSPAPSVASSRNQNQGVPSQTPPVDRSRNQTCEGRDEDDTYSQQFDTLSLGTPVRRRQQGIQHGKVSSSSNGQNTATRTGIISPAKFIYKNSQSRSPILRNLSNTQFNNSNTAGSPSLRQHQFDDESRSSSRFAVVSTSGSQLTSSSSTASSRGSLMSKCILGVSIGLNLCVVIYMVDFKTRFKLLLQYLLWLTET